MFCWSFFLILTGIRSFCSLNFTQKDCITRGAISRDIGDFCDPLHTVYHYWHNNRSCEMWPWGKCRLGNNQFKTMEECKRVAVVICKGVGRATKRKSKMKSFK